MIGHCLLRLLLQQRLLQVSRRDRDEAARQLGGGKEKENPADC
jgi:hypothetical protein